MVSALYPALLVLYSSSRLLKQDLGKQQELYATVIFTRLYSSIYTQLLYSPACILLHANPRYYREFS